MPERGRIAAVVQLRNEGVSFYHRRIDLAGFSNSIVSHRYLIYLTTAPGDTSDEQELYGYEQTLDVNEEFTYVSGNLGEIRRAFVGSQNVYNQGQQLYLAFGLINNDVFWADDMRISSEMKSKWYIQGIELAVIPQP